MAPATFSEALTEAVLLARSAMSDKDDRISAAATLVKNGAVFQRGDHRTWEVASTSKPGTIHLVRGACDCPDFTYRGGPCRHQMAVYLSKKVVKLMHRDADPAPQAPVSSKVEEIPTPPEAFFSATLKGMISGHETLLTVRGMTAEEFTRNLQAVRNVLDAPATTTPFAHVGSPRTSPPETPQCPVHNVQMQRNQKDGRSWYSHWSDEEQRWCKGR